MQAKKHLGQNFLLDETVGRRIVSALDPTRSDTILEIGPGMGFLTDILAKIEAHIIAIEKDRDLIPHLLKKFPLSSNVSIVEGDILNIDISKYTSEKSFKIVGNIPYYITAPIIRKLLTITPSSETIILMVQKEVAERICAKPGDMSILAVATQYYATPEYLFTVPRTAFDPIPQVDSAVVRLMPHKPFDATHDKRLFRLVRIGFASRRKTLANNLAAGLHASKEVITEKIIALGLNPSTRAQELTLHDWEMIHLSFDSFHE